MASSRVEELLEHIASQNSEIIDRLNDLIVHAQDIRDELNATDLSVTNSFAKTVSERLIDIQSVLENRP